MSIDKLAFQFNLAIFAILLLFSLDFIIFKTSYVFFLVLLLSKGVFLSIFIINLLKKSIYSIILPILWFLLIYGIFYIFGPLVYFFGDVNSIEFANTFYYIDYIDVKYVNILNTIFLLAVSILVSPLIHKISNINFDIDYLFKNLDIKAISFFLILIGFIAKYLFYTPIAFGQEDGQAGQILRILSQLIGLGLLPLYYLSRKEKIYRFIFYILFISEVFYGFVEFSKSSILLPFIYLFISQIFFDSNRKALITLILSCIVYATSTPIVLKAREQVVILSGNIFSATFEQRVNILGFAIFTEQQAINDDTSIWWTRLNYANAQSFAMKEFNNNEPGTSLQRAIISPIPRILWRDKPLISTLGLEFNYKINGNPYSWSAPGYIAEYYWNLGWIGVFFGSVLMALSLFITSVFTIRGLNEKKPLFLIMSALGIGIATRIDGWVAISFSPLLLFIIIGVFILPILEPSKK